MVFAAQDLLVKALSLKGDPAQEKALASAGRMLWTMKVMAMNSFLSAFVINGKGNALLSRVGPSMKKYKDHMPKDRIPSKDRVLSADDPDLAGRIYRGSNLSF